MRFFIKFVESFIGFLIFALFISLVYVVVKSPVLFGFIVISSSLLISSMILSAIVSGSMALFSTSVEYFGKSKKEDKVALKAAD